MNNRICWKIFLMLFSLCMGSVAVADEFHYNNLLIGDRASGMGGAYTAISDDATGMYYNPAGIVYVGDRNFSASVNAFYSQTKTYDNVFGSKPFIRKSSALLANYFGIVKPVGKFKIGFSYAVPDAVGEDQNQTFTDVSSVTSRFTINLNNKDTTINFGPSFAAEIGHDLAVGVTLYAHKRNVQLIANQFLERKDPISQIPTTSQWTNFYYSLSEAGVRPVLGVAWSPVEKLSLGVALSKTIVFKASGFSQTTCWDDAVADATIPVGCPVDKPITFLQPPKLQESSAKRKYPIRATLGAAYFANKELLISGDVTYHPAVSDLYGYGNKVATVNAALGTEYYLTKKWAVRAGLFTNMANTENIQVGVTEIEEQVNLYGMSLSITNFSGDASVTLGGSVNYGKGQSQIIAGNSVQNASTFGWLFFLSSSY